MNSIYLKKFPEICLALSSARDRDELLSRILDIATDLARCDGGVVYLLEEDGLHFSHMVIRSLGIRWGGHDIPISLPPVPLRLSHVCIRTALERRIIHIPDVYSDKDFDFSDTRKSDAAAGYHTQSMLLVPLSNDLGEFIGVLQLINAIAENGTATEFSAETRTIIQAIASQVAISLTNLFYSEQITQLLDSLVGALSTAIDAYTPYNANHTRNMVKYATRFLDWLDETNNTWRFDPDMRRAFLLSVWLHDIGKLAIPLEIMDKPTRLGNHLERIEHRFSSMALLAKIELLQGSIDQGEYDRRISAQSSTLAFIHEINAARTLQDEQISRVDEIAQLRYTDENGNLCPWITDEEYVFLSIRRGTLSAEERLVMESHAEVTERILAQVSFPKRYSQVPRWASAHHELLNGHGYPYHQTAESIPPEVRLLTILDIFEALTSTERPYKPGMPVSDALSVLVDMVQDGHLDAMIVALFLESKVWED